MVVTCVLFLSPAVTCKVCDLVSSSVLSFVWYFSWDFSFSPSDVLDQAVKSVVPKLLKLLLFPSFFGCLVQTHLTFFLHHPKCS